jgi:hypothetical protein
LGRKRNACGVSWRNLSGRGRFEDVDVDGGIILILILRMWWEGVGWFNLPRNIEKFWAFVNTVMNLLVP